MTNKSKTLSIVVLAVIGVTVYLFSNVSSAKCPDDYKNIEERTVSFEKWKSDFYNKNSSADLTDYYLARKAFYEDNECKEALERFYKYMVGNIFDEYTSLYVVENIVPEAKIKTNEELCKEGTFKAPLKQEIDYDKSVRKDEFVQYLRKALDTNVLGDNFDLNDYAGYIKSKFIIIDTNIAPSGGESIVLMFKDRPDKVFYAWVYDYNYKGNSGYELKVFEEYNLFKNRAPDIEETQKVFINQLCNDSFGI